MPKWIEVTLVTDGEAAEVIAEVLRDYGYEGVLLDYLGIPPDKLDEDELPPPAQIAVRAYLPDDERAAESQAKLEAALGHMRLMYPMPTPEYKRIDEQDWAEAWKVHYHPVRIGRHVLVRPLWAEADVQPGDVVIALDPGQAFGTGTHPTTQLCLEALEDLVTPETSLVDLGCGSGILSIGAAKLDAARILAVDIDPLAVEVTRENAAQNGVQFEAQRGSLDYLLERGETFDLAAVNILARIIIQMCGEGLERIFRPGAVGIFSGIIAEQGDDVRAALQAAGLEPYRTRQQGDWLVIEARRR